MLWQFVAGILMVLGLFGAVIPFLPGPPLAWLGLLVYGIVTHFTKISVEAVVSFGVLMVLTVVMEIFAPAIVARGYKATRYGSWGAALGGILGIILLGPFGVLLGPLVGALVGEYLALSNSKQAWRSAWGAFVGFLVGTFLKIIATVAMVGYFVYVLFR